MGEGPRLLAGGIGIAPFLSMIRQAVYEAAERQIYLSYSSRYPNSAGYLNDLEGLESCHLNLHVVPLTDAMDAPEVDMQGFWGNSRKDGSARYRVATELRGAAGSAPALPLRLVHER